MGRLWKKSDTSPWIPTFPLAFPRRPSPLGGTGIAVTCGRFTFRNLGGSWGGRVFRRGGGGTAGPFTDGGSKRPLPQWGSAEPPVQNTPHPGIGAPRAGTGRRADEPRSPSHYHHHSTNHLTDKRGVFPRAVDGGLNRPALPKQRHVPLDRLPPLLLSDVPLRRGAPA